MEKKSWSDVVKPSGSILPNWHIILGVLFSLVAGIGLIVTSDDPVVPIAVDPFDIEVDLDPAEASDESTVAGLTRSIQEDADARARELNAARQRAQQEAQRRERAERLEAQERERAYREALRTLDVLRSRPAQPDIDRGLTDNLAESSSEAEMRQAMRLEELQRQNQAYRAPMVASSARGIGEQAHALDRPEITETYERPPELRPGALGPPPPVSGPRPGAVRPGPSLPGTVPPQSRVTPGSPRPAPPRTGGAASPGIPGDPFAPARPAGGAPASLPGQSSIAIAPPVSGPGAPEAVVQSAPPDDAEVPFPHRIGPRADGGRSPDTGVVVTPVDAPNYRLYEGTLIPAVLQTQINGAFSGPISAQVTRHVYSEDRQRILVPRGTRVLGTAGSVEGPFQDRLAVGFHRLIFPDGGWLLLNFAGLNSMGETSLRDLVNRHYIQTFGTVGAIGLLAGLTQSSGVTTGGIRSGMSEQMAAMALAMMQRFLNRPPEVTIRAGHPVNVYLTSDVLFPPHATWHAN